MDTDLVLEKRGCPGTHEDEVEPTFISNCLQTSSSDEAGEKLAPFVMELTNLVQKLEKQQDPAGTAADPAAMSC